MGWAQWSDTRPVLGRLAHGDSLLLFVSSHERACINCWGHLDPSIPCGGNYPSLVYPLGQRGRPDLPIFFEKKEDLSRSHKGVPIEG